uniref:Uncharacterized protein n=1 Tax=Rhizophora mucronata TaxID=61149 RepID=A0A2P2L536_RHIMU
MNIRNIKIIINPSLTFIPETTINLATFELKDDPHIVLRSFLSGRLITSNILDIPQFRIHTYSVFRTINYTTKEIKRMVSPPFP